MLALLIGSQKKIKKIVKFHGLCEALDGDAKEIIEHLEYCEESYDESWNLLRARYDNMRLMIDKHINLLLERTRIQEGAAELRSLIDSVQSTLRTLKVLEI